MISILNHQIILISKLAPYSSRRWVSWLWSSPWDAVSAAAGPGSARKAAWTPPSANSPRRRSASALPSHNLELWKKYIKNWLNTNSLLCRFVFILPNHNSLKIKQKNVISTNSLRRRSASALPGHNSELWK